MSGPLAADPIAAPYVLAFGDSLTQGYGLGASESFAARLQALLREQAPHAIVQNAGVSGDTSAHGLSRLPRLLSGLTHKPDLAIVEFGANDLLRGIHPDRTRANLDAILREFARCGIPVLLAAMQAPLLLGELARAFNKIYDELGAAHAVPVHPFFPAGVMAHPELVLRDRIHPNARAIAMVAQAMLPVVRAALPSRAEAA